MALLTFSTIPNLALRLGLQPAAQSLDQHGYGFSTIPNLALRLGSDISVLGAHELQHVFNYSEFSPSVGWKMGLRGLPKLKVFNYSEFSPSVGGT